MPQSLYAVSQPSALHCKPIELHRSLQSRLELEVHPRIATLRLSGGMPERNDFVSIVDHLLRAVAASGCDVVILQHTRGVPVTDTAPIAELTDGLLETLAVAFGGAGLRLWLTVPDGWNAYQFSLRLDRVCAKAELQHLTCSDLDAAIQFAHEWQLNNPLPELPHLQSVTRFWPEFGVGLPTLN